MFSPVFKYKTTSEKRSSMKNFSLKDEYLASFEHIKQNAKRKILLQIKPQTGVSN